MQKAAEDAERTIALLSPAYLAARYTQPEWAAAFSQDPTGHKRILVPARIHDCDLTGLLPQIVYIDLVALEEEPAKRRLLEGVQRERAKPSSPPNFPSGSTSHCVGDQPYFPGDLPTVQSPSGAPSVQQVPWIVVRLSRANATEYRLEDGRHSRVLGSTNNNY